MLTVTAVITTHNREKLLKRAIKSVLSQNYEALDLLVVDDASTDGTQQYMSRLAEKNSRVKYLRIPPEETKGSNNARNVGIRAAAGEIIAFLDDDDVWLRGKITEQSAYFQQHPNVGAICCDWYDVYCFGKKKYRFRHNFSFTRGKNEFFITPYLGGTCGMAVRRELLEKIGGFDETLPEMHEVELSYRLTMASEVGYIDRPYFEYYHYHRSGSISGSVVRYEEAQRIVKKKYAEQFSEMTADQKRRYRAAEIKEIAYRFLMSDDRKSYRERIRPYLRLYGAKEKTVYCLSYVFGFKTFVKLKYIMKAVKNKIK